MKTLSDRREQVLKRIRQAATRAGRDHDEVRLLAVSKKHPVQAIEEMADAGQRAFGENYVDEALVKIEQLAHRDLEWHYIGPIQSNKTAAIAGHFQWVQSVDRDRVLRRLAEQRPADLPPLNVLIQVRIGGEASKSGCEPEGVFDLVEQARAMTTIRLRGLMTIPPPSTSMDDQRGWFGELRSLYDRLRDGGMELDTLSMGMTDDLEAAIDQGATLVRIGTALFGPRPA